MSVFISKLEAMKIIWEGEGHKWDDLYELPYSEEERQDILKRLSETVKKLETSVKTKNISSP